MDIHNDKHINVELLAFISFFILVNISNLRNGSPLVVKHKNLHGGY